MTQTVEIWHRAEITLHSARAHDHPDTEVDVRAEFVGPNGRAISLPGFWDGGDVWKVRFAPPGRDASDVDGYVLTGIKDRERNG